VRSKDVRGLRLPAEWEQHRATWLIWPHNPRDWEIKMSSIRWVFLEMIRHLSESEKVSIIFQSKDHQKKVCKLIERAGIQKSQLEMQCVKTDRSWIRDTGPLIVHKTARSTSIRQVATDWRFNGWARYKRFTDDDKIAKKISALTGMEHFRVHHPIYGEVVLEGGAVDVNGQGDLLATEECLLGSPQCRNPQLDKNDLEEVFRDVLGVQQVLWLGQGICGDDTHGHVDDVARFVACDTVVAAVETDSSDENYGRLKENLRRLKSMRTAEGVKLKVVTVPMPKPLYFDNNRLPASYLNFYISNRKVLVPTFNDPSDRVVLTSLSKVFPNHQVIGIHSVDLVLGLGAIHCLTMQEPRIPVKR